MLTANPGGSMDIHYVKNYNSSFKLFLEVSNSQFYVLLVVSVKLVYHDIADPLKKLFMKLW